MTMQIDRPHRELCPEADFRDSLDDGEFWDYVFNGIKPGDPVPEYEPDDDDINAGTGPFDGPILNPCEVCGEWGPCGYDNEGRVLIHLVPDEEDA